MLIPAPRLRFYAGVGFVTAATLMLQIVETRIISVTSWYHLAFFVISLAMFGLTAGAVWVYLRRQASRPDELSYDLSVASLAFALASVLALLFQLTIVTSVPASIMAFVVWVQFAVALSLPFFFAGVVVSLALTRSPYAVGIVYGVDLCGAALGCLAALVLLNLVSGPSAALWIAALAAAGGLLFSGASPEGAARPSTIASRLHQRRWGLFGALCVLAAANSLTTAGVRPTVVKDKLERPEHIAYERWNSFSRITVDHSGKASPALWGRSSQLPPQEIEQRWMTIDGLAGTAVYRFTGKLDELSFLRYDVTNLAYAVPGLKTAAVIGVGAGRDLLSARLFGVPEVVGVEINPIFIDLLRRHFADYTAIGRVPGISFEVDEARSWFARTGRSFDLLQMSLIASSAATGAGAFTLSENGLYTVEAWRVFLERLTPEGVFRVSRWYAPGEVNETGRMISLGVAALLANGAAEPRRHLFLAAAGNVATLIVTKSPLSPAALLALKDAADSNEFTVLLSPDTVAPSAMLEKIVSATGRRALDQATTGFYLDLTPPTDERPLFFNQLGFATLFDADMFSHFTHTGVVAGNLVATLTLVMLVLVSVALVGATIIVWVRPTVREAGWQLAVGGTVYFALMGVCSMLVEVIVLQ